MRYFISILAFAPILCQAQSLVDHAQQLRTALLEEYAAVNCGNCPASHVLADTLLAHYPNALVAVEVHGGSLSVPSSGQPDFRNPSATALWSFYNVTSQPRGAIDRIPISGQVVASTGTWTDAVPAALALSSPVNLGMSSTFDATTRELTVNVELYYTADGTGGNDRISVLLKEDHIIGYQQDYVNGPQAAYDHNNILRGYITDLWGDEVTESASGSTALRTYSFTVPAGWNIENCDAVAFVGEYQGEIYQVRSVAADGGFTGVEDVSSEVTTGHAYPVPADRQVVILVNASKVPRTLSIRDALGRVVDELPVPSGTQEISLVVSAYPNGTYFYSLSTAAAVRTGRLIIAH